MLGFAPQTADASTPMAPRARRQHVNPRPPADQISIDMAGLLLDNQVAVEFSHRFDEMWMLDLTPRLGVGALGSIDPFGVAALGSSFGLSLGSRWFVADGAPSGVFLGAATVLDCFTAPRGNLFRTMLRSELGYQWCFAGRWTLGVSAGAAYAMFTSTLKAENPAELEAQVIRLRGFRPDGRLRLGLAF